MKFIRTFIQEISNIFSKSTKTMFFGVCWVFCFLCLWLDGFWTKKNLENAWVLAKHMSKICGKSLNIRPKVMPNLSKINQKSTPNRSKYVLGAFSAPNRAQVGNRTPRVVWCNHPRAPFWPKMSLQGSIFGPPKNRKSLPKRTFEDRRVLAPSKNGLWEGARKKHEN